jgi:RNA-binding protein NOB1
VDDLAQEIENVELQGRPEDEEQDFGDSDDDSEGWITPSNLHHHIHPTSSPVNSPKAEIEKLAAALATTDFAMQNTLLQLNIHFLSPSTLMQIKHIRSTALRGHACFFIIKHPTATTSHFCPRCGAGDTVGFSAV